MRIPLVYLLCARNDYAAALRYADGLQDRRIDCKAVDVEAVTTLASLLTRGASVVLFSATTEWPFAKFESELQNLDERDARTVTVFTIGSGAPALPQSIRIINAGLIGLDRGLAHLLHFIFGSPRGVELICVPSQMMQVTGVSWWNEEEIIVADEYFGHVLRIRKRHETTVLLVGLDEPYHLHLDRRILAVSDLGANEVLTGRIVLGALTDVIAIPIAANERFKRPHGVFQGTGFSVIADTDNHRVLWKKRHIRSTEENWNEIKAGFLFPHAVCADRQQIWVADTANGRIVRFRPSKSGRMEGTETQLGHLPRHASPVGVCRAEQYLLVSDDANGCVSVFKVPDRGNSLPLVAKRVLSEFVASPLGLSVNRGRRLAIADRGRGVVWVSDLDEVVAAGAAGEVRHG
jgi:hypothetical protein